jgi:hypothetical protein
MLFPDFGQFFLGIILFSPLSGLLYWKKSGRLEKVSLKMENILSGTFKKMAKNGLNIFKNYTLNK